MKNKRRTLLLRENETLGEWIERLANHIAESKPEARKIHEILHEVSVQSYIAGTNTERELCKKYDHNNTKIMKNEE